MSWCFWVPEVEDDEVSKLKVNQHQLRGGRPKGSYHQKEKVKGTRHTPVDASSLNILNILNVPFSNSSHADKKNKDLVILFRFWNLQKVTRTPEILNYKRNFLKWDI